MNIHCASHVPSVLPARRRVEGEFVSIRQAEPRISRLTLNEAEAIAWQSGWPDLVFPVLAEEKLQALLTWHRGQRALWGLDS